MPTKTSKAKPTSKPAAAKLALPVTWGEVSAIVALPDGGVVAGTTGRVAAWRADGSLVWDTALGLATKIQTLTIGGAQIAAHGDDSRTVFLLDRTTGAVQGAHDPPGAWVRTIAITPDGANLVARVGNETLVFALPGPTHVKTLAEYVNESPIACSPTHLAVAGHEVHVFALPSLAHVATFEPEDSPFHLAWTPDGKLVTAGNGGFVGVFESDGTQLAGLDSTPEKTTKKDATSLAANATHVAVTRADGVVIVLDRETEVEAARFPKQKDAPVAFAPDGTLWIGAARYAIA